MGILKRLKKERRTIYRLLIGATILSFLAYLLIEIFPDQLKIVLSPSLYAAIHNIAELFSIMVSLSIFGFGWFTFEQTRDRYALFMSAAFLAIGVLDTMHMLSNAAMPDFFSANSSNKASQFWIVARFVTAGSFLISAFIFAGAMHRWINKQSLAAGVFGIIALTFTTITYFPDYVPATFVVGSGVTLFKKVAEYIIIVLFILSFAAYGWRLNVTGERRLIFYMAAFIFSIFSEMVLALYTRPFDTYNIIGHIYKTAAFCLIYAGVFTESIKKPYIRLVAAKATLQEELIERRLMEEEIRMHRDHLGELVELRTEQLHRTNEELESFSYSVSHDLRAPLRAIDGFARMLMIRMRDKLNDEEAKSFDVIRSSAKKMEQLIDDLLSFSRCGRQEMAKSEIKMEEIIRDVWNELLAITPDRNLSLVVQPMAGIQGDPSLMRHVLSNLLSNAVKFTQVMDPAVIEVGCIHNDGHMTYYVKDNGIGFDMKFHDKIFGVFQRLHGTDSYEGTGIGLALVRRIIQRHGGRVWAQSEVDKGATFYFSIPSSLKGHP